jgi:Putative Ig domain
MYKVNKISRTNTASTILGLLSIVLLSGCLTSGSTDEPGSQNPPGNPPANNAPVISGTPSSSVVVGQTFSFTPTASDGDGDSLTFSISNAPRWASFDATSGRLSGTPNLGDEGVYASIRITVSDGTAQASLPTFSISVNQSAMGSATLSWNPPTQNDDGSPLNNLAGYKLYYGVTRGVYNNEVRIDNPGITTYVVENLSPQTYYFVATAFNANGVESQFSNEATKTVN